MLLSTPARKQNMTRNMTKLDGEAIETLKALPPDRQDEAAKLLLSVVD
jgi:hypothetical protein